MPNLIIGSRGSRLALWQAEHIKAEIERAHPGLVVAIEVIKTTGDKLTEASLAQIGGKGVFTKEIEEALLAGRVDLAVHSLKDLPTTLPAGLHLAAITEREDVRDALIVRGELGGAVKAIKNLPHGARIGTSSLRRAAQLRHLRPDLSINELRGNVETRLRKLDAGEHDAIILAAAGLNRLGFGARITTLLEADEMLSAVGQGALGIETRIDDARTNLLLDFLNHWPTRQATEAERAVLRELGGGCAVPIAALGSVNAEGDQLTLTALVAELSGKLMLRERAEGAAARGEEIGAELAERLIKRGARDLLPRLGAQATTASSGNTSGAAARSVGMTAARSEAKQNPERAHNPQKADSAATQAAPASRPQRPAPTKQAPHQPDVAAREQTTQAAPTPHTPVAPPRPAQSSARAAVSDLMRQRRRAADQQRQTEQEAKEEKRAEDTAETAAPPVVEPPAALPASAPSRTPRAQASTPPPPSRVAEPSPSRVGQSRKPLAGRRVIVTRSIKQSGEITRALEHFGAEVIACPTIEIKPPLTWDALDRALIHLSWYDWLVFTSANGVEYFLQRLDQLGHGRAELMSHKVCAVGRKTAAKLKSEQITVDLVPERFTAEALVEAFIKTFGVRQRLRGARMLLPAARATRDVIRPALEKLGVHVEVVEAYQTVLPATANAEVAQTLREANADYIIFTSPSTVANLAALLETDHLTHYLAHTRIACIGPVTSEAARSYGLDVHLQPEEHTSQAIVLAIVADGATNMEESAKDTK